MIGTIIGTIIFGAIIGALARLVLPGKQNIAVVVTVILGILGALIGYWLADLLGVQQRHRRDRWIRWFISASSSPPCSSSATASVTGKKQV